MSERKQLYDKSKKAKVGDEIICPVCKTTFTKRQWQQSFCCPDCKNTYWNAKGDRHKNPNYYSKYNMKHPERLERILGMGATRSEKERNEALYALATDEGFREYVNEPPMGDEAESFSATVDLYTMYRNYYGMDAE